jgi:thiol-disulfide isomerase/thioredoxin
MQDEYENEFLPFFRINDQLFDTLQNFFRRNYQKYGQDLPELIRDSANHLREKYYHQRADLLSKYIKSHLNSYVALWDIDYYLSLNPIHKYFNFENLFSSFSPQMQDQPFMQLMKEKLKESNKLEIGKEFPQDFFTGYEQMHSKIQKNNKYYLIDFWYSRCGPCIARFPKLKEIYNQYYSKGFDIVSISVDKQKDEEDYFAQIKKNKLPWNLIWDKDGATSYQFSINAFPTYILVDKNDKIINTHIEVSQLEDFLKRNL